MKLLLALVLALPMLANASLSYEHYMNIIKGEYKIVLDPAESVFSDVIEFKITNSGKITLSDELEGSTHTNFFVNDMGPIGLPTTTVMAYYYSDEQTEGYNLTLSAEEGEPSRVLIQDLVFTANDGPNEWTFIEKVKKYKVLKKDKSGKYREVTKI